MSLIAPLSAIRQEGASSIERSTSSLRQRGHSEREETVPMMTGGQGCGWCAVRNFFCLQQSGCFYQSFRLYPSSLRAVRNAADTATGVWMVRGE